MIGPGTREYWCSRHGYFDAVAQNEERDRDSIWEQPCPTCGQMSELKHRPFGGLTQGCGPAILGDVQGGPFRSQHTGRWFDSKRELREQHRAMGMQPMSDRDLRDAQDKAVAADRRGREMVTVEQADEPL